MAAAINSAPAVVRRRPSRAASCTEAPAAAARASDQGTKVRAVCRGEKPRPSCNARVSTRKKLTTPEKKVSAASTPPVKARSRNRAGGTSGEPPRRALRAC